MLCDYGCGQEAQFQMKNGKWCCSANISKCPTIRKKLRDNHADAKQVYKNLSIEAKERMNWNKGLTAETHESIKKAKLKIQRQYASGQRVGTFTGRKHTPKTKELISKRTSESYNYNVHRRGGLGKKGWYKGFWCDSTYELAYVIYCLDHNIPIERNRKYFLYEYQGSFHRYYPDFIVNGQIIEIKGYANGALPYKIQALKDSGCDFQILFAKDLQHVFQYIKETYGKEVNKNISDLYENS